jgi:hypothetical protein
LLDLYQTFFLYILINFFVGLGYDSALGFS